MAKQFRVSIDGNAVPNVLDVEYGLDVGKDTNGAPVDSRPRLASIKITRRSDEATDYWTWAIKPHQEYFKAGKIEFLDPRKENKVLKTLEWKNGFIESYEEVVPHVNQAREAPQTEIFFVSAPSLTINGVQWGDPNSTWGAELM
jgi:hypothetical protein